MRATTRRCLTSALLLVASAASAEPSLRGTRVRGVVAIQGDGFPANAIVDVLVDPAWPHASIACHASRTRTAHADARGHFVVELAPRDECRLGRDRYRAYADRDGVQLAVSPAFD
ncbi:MAG TPA: hypothetical protein VGL61_28490 [Kofleriaceae bacterium]|jgi:hypothetical protein